MEQPEIPMNDEQLKRLAFLCDRTLRAHPELEDWLVHINISASVRLPFLPIRCFRLCSVSRFPDVRASHSSLKHFLSSGSTQAVRATHHMGSEGLAAYKVSALEGFQTACLRLGIPEGTPVVSLVPPADVWSDSSLAAMVSFWKENGIPVSFADIHSDPNNLAALLQVAQKQNPALRNFILFGTSLHHLQVSQWQRQENAGKPFIDADTVWLFDTGGTKGRTQHTTQAELHAAVREWFAPDCHVHLLSEYGMCELASQAYSVSSPNTGQFACAPQLKAFAIAPSLDALVPQGEKGFLGFVDGANVDSWPFVITEDLGSVQDASHTRFVLEGRAPDATVKGCSLNVRSTYRFDLTSSSDISGTAQSIAPQELLRAPASKRSLFSAASFLKKLDRRHWTPSSLADLETSLQRWNSDEQEQALIRENALVDETLAIVSAANTPIAWLFPAVHAWLMGAERVRLHLPSLRQDDPLSTLVRGQTIALATAFNSVTQSAFIEVAQGRILSQDNETRAHRIVLFGSDETLSTVSIEIQKRGTQTVLIGLGDFQNSARADENTSPTEVALMCSRWWGRGCLTPVQLELPEHWTQEHSQTFTQAVFTALKTEMGRRWEEAKSALDGVQLLQRFAHQHNRAEARVLCHQSQLPLDIFSDAGSGVAVADLTRATDIPAQLQLSFKNFGGCGWLTIVRSRNKFPEVRSSVEPTLWDLHQGKTWQQWLLKKA
jgi:hypothetical protein